MLVGKNIIFFLFSWISGEPIFLRARTLHQSSCPGLFTVSTSQWVDPLKGRGQAKTRVHSGGAGLVGWAKTGKKEVKFVVEG